MQFVKGSEAWKYAARWSMSPALYANEGERWVTIGGQKTEEGRKGGRPVLIDKDGVIVGGSVPKETHGKPVGEFGKHVKGGAEATERASESNSVVPAQSSESHETPALSTETAPEPPAATSRFKPGNPFAAKAEKARAKLDELRKQPQTVDNIRKAVKLLNDARGFEAKAKSYDEGRIDEKELPTPKVAKAIEATKAFNASIATPDPAPLNPNELKEKFPSARVISEEDYIGGRHPWGDPGMHMANSRQSPGQRERQLQHALAQDAKAQQTRDQKRAEYRDLVANGEVRPPTRTESTLAIAMGHEDNASVQAARRILDGMGVDWKAELAKRKPQQYSRGSLAYRYASRWSL